MILLSIERLWCILFNNTNVETVVFIVVNALLKIVGNSAS